MVVRKKALHRMLAASHFSGLTQTGVVLTGVELLDWGVTSASAPQIPILVGTTGNVPEGGDLPPSCLNFSCADYGNIRLLTICHQVAQNQVIFLADPRDVEVRRLIKDWETYGESAIYVVAQESAYFDRITIDRHLPHDSAVGRLLNEDAPDRSSAFLEAMRCLTSTDEVQRSARSRMPDVALANVDVNVLLTERLIDLIVPSEFDVFLISEAGPCSLGHSIHEQGGRGNRQGGRRERLLH